MADDELLGDFPEPEVVEGAGDLPSPRKPFSHIRKSVSSMEMKTLTKYAEGMQSGKKTSLTKCARAAGYSESYAPTAARRIKELMTQNESVRAMMESKGIGLECLVDDLGELRHAITPSGHPDNLIRQRNAEFRAQLLDALPPKRMELDERRVNITISGEDLERLKKHFGEIAIK